MNFLRDRVLRPVVRSVQPPLVVSIVAVLFPAACLSLSGQVLETAATAAGQVAVNVPHQSGKSPDQGPAKADELPELIPQSGHSGPILATASSGKNLVATASADGTVKVWSQETGRLLRTLRVSQYWVYSVTFSTDGTFLAAGSGDNSVRIWDTGSWNQLQALTGHSHAVTHILFSPDGKKIASGSASDKGDPPGNLISVWDVNSGKQLFHIDRIGEVTGLRFDGNDKLAASITGEASNVEDAWNLDNGEPLTVSEPGTVPGSKAEPVVQSSEQNTTAPKGSIELPAWQENGGQPPPPQAIRAISVSADGKKIAVGKTDGSVTLWDLKSGQPSHYFEAQGMKDNNVIHSLGFTPDGQHFFSASWNSGVWLWNLAPFGPPQQFHSPLNKEDLELQRIHAEVNPRSRPGAAPAPPSRLIAVVDGQHVPPTEEVYTAATSPSGKLVAYGGYSYDDVTRGNFFSIIDWEKQQTVDYVLGLPGVGNATALSFAADGTALAVGYSDGTIGIRDISAHKFVQTQKLHTGSTNAVAFSSTGRFVATAGSDHLVKVWDLSSGKLLSLAGHSAPVLCVAFSNDGTRLVSGGADGRIAVWRLDTGERLQTIDAHVSAVNAVVFSPTANLLISGSEDGTIRFWNSSSYELLGSAVTFGKNQWLVFSPEGFFDGTQLAWQLAPFRFPSEPTRLYQPEQFFNEFYQPNLLADVLGSGKPMFQILREREDPRSSFKVSTYRNSSLPSLRLTPPSTGNTSSERSIQIAIAAEDTGSGLRDLRVFRNQTLVHVEHGDLRADPLTKKFEIVVPVKISAGENTISAYVFNRDNIKSKDARIVITGASSLTRPGKAYILAIGINDYSNPGFNLHFANPDAQTFASVLGRSLAELKTYDQIVPVLLLDASATKQNVRAALQRLAGKIEDQVPDLPPQILTLQAAQPEDSVFIYFAGHGAAQNDRYYLIPHDLGYQGDVKRIGLADRLAILQKSLSDLDFEGTLETIDSSRILFIIDACQSGQILEADEKRRGPMNSRGLAQLAYEKGAYILAAAQSYQAALEFKRLGHGILTYVLMDGLTQYAADADKDGVITAAEWLQYATQQVPLEVQSIEQAHVTETGRDVDYGEIAVTGQAPRSYFRQDLEENWIIAGTRKRNAPN